MREIKFKRVSVLNKTVCEPMTLLELIEFYADVVGSFGENKFIQYTGLKDKNGVEIYEGDILSIMYNAYFKNFKYQSVVSWNNKSLQYNGLEDVIKLGINICEVIGNIYENKDLLE